VTETTPIARHRTPGAIYFSLACFAFAFASPIIGEYASHGHRPENGSPPLNIIIYWTVAGILVAGVGVVRTFTGGGPAPRSVLTIFTMILAALWAPLVLLLLIVLFT